MVYGLLASGAGSADMATRKAGVCAPGEAAPDTVRGALLKTAARLLGNIGAASRTANLETGKAVRWVTAELNNRPRKIPKKKTKQAAKISKMLTRIICSIEVLINTGFCVFWIEGKRPGFLTPSEKSPKSSCCVSSCLISAIAKPRFSFSCARAFSLKSARSIAKHAGSVYCRHWALKKTPREPASVS